MRIYANDRMIAKIPRGRRGLLSYQADPGQLRISSGMGTGNMAGDVFRYGAIVAASGQKADRVVFDVSPGSTYYVRLQHGFWHEVMSLVPKEEAEREIKDCHWINPPTK